MKTQSKNGGRKNTRRRPTPGLDEILAQGVKGGLRPKKAPTAEQIADSFEEQARKFMDIAHILRGKT